MVQRHQLGMCVWERELAKAEIASAGFRSNGQGKSGKDRHNENLIDTWISTRTNANNVQDGDLAEPEVSGEVGRKKQPMHREVHKQTEWTSQVRWVELQGHGLV